MVRGCANRLRAEWGLQDDFVLAYSGNLGIGHEFEALLRGFAMARRRSARFDLLSSAREVVEEVRRLASERDLGDAVRFSACFQPIVCRRAWVSRIAGVTLRPGLRA